MSKVKTMLSLIHTPLKMIQPAGQNNLLNWVPDKIYLKTIFKIETGYPLNIEHPKTYNEKLQWLKLYDRNPDYTVYADKYRVRKYIADTLGEEYLVPIVGVYEKAEDIPWEKLPNRFVLKCNHASGTNIICKDKALLDVENATKMLNYWLKKNAYWLSREWCYKDIKPCIICEEFIETSDGNTPDDYKVMCFNGEPRLIQVHHDRYGEHTLDFMDINWKKTGIVQGPPNSDSEISKPVTFDKMIECSRILSRNMYYSRIDFYSVEDRLLFGEITMYPTGGLAPFGKMETDFLLGEWIKLPVDK